MKPLAKLIVLISGEGTNLQAILDACTEGVLPVEVVTVIANNPDAKGLARAERMGVPTKVKQRLPSQNRLEYDRELAQLVNEFNPDWVVLAGWMHLLSDEFLKQFPNKVINLHPALPGTFPGINAIARAHEAYLQGEIQQTGVMVHLVDEGVDTGPVLQQAIVPIFFTDTLEILSHRIHLVEQDLLIKTLIQLTKTIVEPTSV